MISAFVSVPFTSGSSLQLTSKLFTEREIGLFQFPLHRDPRCNNYPRCYPNQGSIVSVPFTSGSSLQPEARRRSPRRYKRFSSLYIGILAATSFERQTSSTISEFQFPLHRDPRCNSAVCCWRSFSSCFSSLYIGILAATSRKR